MDDKQERELLEWLGIPCICDWGGNNSDESEADLSFAIIEKMREKGYQFSIATHDSSVCVEICCHNRMDTYGSESDDIPAAIKQAAYNAMREGKAEGGSK